METASESEAVIVAWRGVAYGAFVSLADVTADAVVAAMAECDRLGDDVFLDQYGFGRARSYLLVHGGRAYDSKAIVGVAHSYAAGEPLRAGDFSGGEQTVGRLLTRLGFQVRKQGNPDWTWDEIVLACDLVAGNGWRELDHGDDRVRELSELLQRLPIHDPMDRGEKFRNRNGVARKTADIATAHPDYRGRPTRGSRLDREVLTAFLERPAEMGRTAAAIRTAAAAGEFDGINSLGDAASDEFEAPEGRLLVRRHVLRERNRSLRDRKIQRALADSGRLACEACGFDFRRAYGQRGDGFIECHHVVPLHVGGQSRSTLDDLSLLCANCHRMIHCKVPWISVIQLKRILNDNA